MSTLKDLRDERIKKLTKLKTMGINPYPPHAQKTSNNIDLITRFEEHIDKDVSVTGRIMSLRAHGHLIFLDLIDFSGKIQLYIKDTELAPTNIAKQTLGFNDLNLLDIGDFLQVTGTVTKTKTGEVSVLAKELKLLTKSLRPLPDKHEGLKDHDTIFRRRYLDLVINPERKDLFVRKSNFWRACRDFMQDKGFLEVETPVLEHVTGGADAKPFITHHDALDEDFYLRISTELFQKRLIGGGFEKIYTLAPNFRNEGLSDEHLQEYYSLEWYWAYVNYESNMKLVRDLLIYVANKVYGKTSFTKDNFTFDLANEWEVIDYAQVIKKRFNVDVFDTPESELLTILNKEGVVLPGAINRNRLIDNLWKVIRRDVSGPAFLINQPKFISPLAKAIPGNERYTERFQIVIAGGELGNGYSELNDPFDQLARFQEQQDARDDGDDEAQMLDIDFVEMLEYGMPPTSGFGMSERVFWFLEGVTAREGTFFPQMRKKLDETTIELYNLKSPNTSKNNIEKPLAGEKKDTSSTTPKFSVEEAHKLLDEYVKDSYQKLHAIMVATALKSYAQKLKQDENLWYITGLLHDLDYEKFPDTHPQKSLEWFTTWDYPQELIDAVDAHAHRITNKEPTTALGAALIAVDELAGFLYAYSLMKPEGFEGMDPNSVKKKFKDKAFARKIDREDITYGIEKFKVDFLEHVQFLINIFKDMRELKKS